MAKKSGAKKSAPKKAVKKAVKAPKAAKKQAAAPGLKFRVQQLHVDNNEGCAVADFDRDANPDLLLGDYWLRNTEKDWSKHEIGQVKDLSPEAEADRNRAADRYLDGRNPRGGGGAR